MNSPTQKHRRFNFGDLRDNVRREGGPNNWRSLDELAGTDEFRKFLHGEFPEQAPAFSTEVGRRGFLKLMGASLAFGGLTACGIQQPREEIVPYVRAPEEIVPGQPLYFATAMPLGGVGLGLLVESHMGRPTKIEGNPSHPASLGGTDAIAQASVLELYDPDRSKSVAGRGRLTSWSSFLGPMREHLANQNAKNGAGLRILTGAVSSPTLGRQLQELLEQYPAARWHQYDPLWRDSAFEGGRQAFGEPIDLCYRLKRADVVLSLDADFLTQGPGHVRYLKDFASRRTARNGGESLNRFYAVESMPTATGTMADHRLSLAVRDIEIFVRALAWEFGIGSGPAAAALGKKDARWLKAVKDDLFRHKGSCLVIPGSHLSAEAHALSHAINHALGNFDRTLYAIGNVAARPENHLESLRDLVEEMKAEKVEVLLILGANPVYTAPADLEFSRHLRKVPMCVHHGLYQNETAGLCQWHIPAAHYLESWSDIRAFDGTVSIVQPLIAPLYNGRSEHEFLAALMGQTGKKGYEIVRKSWKEKLLGGEDEALWRRALHDGVVSGTASPPKAVKLASALRTSGSRRQPLPPSPRKKGLELVFRLDPSVADGRFANNGWLQELPKPLTKIVWENAALIGVATAEAMGLANGDLVELKLEGRSLEAPVWIVPGHGKESVTLHLGYGRKRAGRVGNGLGFDANALRVSYAPGAAHGAKLVQTRRQHSLVSTQHHHSMESRHLVRTATKEQFARNPDFVHESKIPGLDENLSLYPGFEYDGYAWSMVVDLGACVGCNACVTACQAENNVPVVGKEEVAAGREMHWLRVDGYHQGSPDAPKFLHQPVMCQHCEQAPCEVVCPVNATVHSPEGLNEMVYNRCVGTRYCSNNCPYKVRRFNFYQYSDLETESLKLGRNPDVTVRNRGVMEKCSYCVQRINLARIAAKNEDRVILDGEVVTACQSACPTDAIVFGDRNDKGSRVAKLQGSPLNYGLLTELGTRPRTSYLARVTNPNPEIEAL